MENTEMIYSHHVFLFPFRWDMGDVQSLAKKTFSERLKRQEFVKLLSERWKKSEYFKKDPINYYNSANYFYEFARKAIYAFDGDESTVLNYHFDQQAKKYKYLIERSMSGGSVRIYELEVLHFGLNIYDTGIGILSFHLLNKSEDQKNLDDILVINDFGRRMYPQFLDTDAKSSRSGNIIELTHAAFLAKSIVIKSDAEDDPVFSETFSDFSCEEKLKERIESNFPNLPNTPKNIAKFLGEKIGTTEHKLHENMKATIRPILDDRNFVLCWYGNKDETARLGWNNESRNYNYLNYEVSNEWLMYVFVDNSNNTIQSRRMRPEMAVNHTYDRWLESLTLFGLTRYSIVCLSDVEWFHCNILRKQIGGGVYFEMAQLLLAQRSSIIRFSDEATLLASKHFDTIEVRELHERYMRFVNRLYFREATAQEQGIEMYRQMSDHMQIDRDVENLNREIDELHQFVSMEEQEKLSRSAWTLNRIGLPLLVVSVITGILGMNVFDKENFPRWGAGKYDPRSTEWILLVVAAGIILGALTLRLAFKLNKIKHKK